MQCHLRPGRQHALSNCLRAGPAAHTTVYGSYTLCTDVEWLCSGGSLGQQCRRTAAVVAAHATNHPITPTSAGRFLRELPILRRCGPVLLQLPHWQCSTGTASGNCRVIVPRMRIVCQYESASLQQSGSSTSGYGTKPNRRAPDPNNTATNTRLIEMVDQPR